MQGEAERARRAANAEAVKLEGDAEASAIAARGHAEADSMRQKAEAYEQYGDAAIVDLLAKTLPDIVRAAAEPISAIDKMTVVSTDGASALTRNVTTNVAQGIQLASDLTGVDLTALFASFANRAAPSIEATETDAATPSN
jgi:flotillin